MLFQIVTTQTKLICWNNFHITGLLKGRYYDSQGRETPYLENFNRKIEQCNEEKEIAKKKNQEYPPCNIAWSEEEGTKVWCTKNR